MVPRAAHFAKKLRQFSPNAALVKINFFTKVIFIQVLSIAQRFSYTLVYEVLQLVHKEILILNQIALKIVSEINIDKNE